MGYDLLSNIAQQFGGMLGNNNNNNLFENEINDEINDEINVESNKTTLYYNEAEEIQNEINAYNYHKYKNTGDWLLAKTIINYSNNDSNNTEYLWDYLDLLFKNNNDDFNNIKQMYYSSNESVFEFNDTVSKYIIDNLKICKYKPHGYINGYIFNKNENNIFNFNLVIITHNQIYCINRYVDENKLGCY